MLRFLVLEHARGHDECHEHPWGGAIFWFTIMTTIGMLLSDCCYPNLIYKNQSPWTHQCLFHVHKTFKLAGWGNTRPLGSDAQFMIYTCGFVCILLFGFLVSVAGNAMISVFEAFANFHRMGFLTKGWCSVVFWFSMLAVFFFFFSWLYYYIVISRDV